MAPPAGPVPQAIAEYFKKLGEIPVSHIPGEAGRRRRRPGTSMLESFSTNLTEAVRSGNPVYPVVRDDRYLDIARALRAGGD